MSAAVQPQFIRSDVWLEDRLGPARAKWAYAFKTLLDAGVSLAGSTDCPVEPPLAGEVYSGFVRRADSHDDEALRPEEAIHALTLGAARSLGEEETFLEEGASADFLILSPDAAWPPPPESPWPLEGVVTGGVQR